MSENQRAKHRNKVVFGLLMTIIGIGILYGAWSMATVEPSMHKYTVKAEQVNEDEMVERAIEYENLSEPEKTVLYRAFKQSDHFLGGAEAYIMTEEPINVSSEWRVIEIRGVPMLVAMGGPEPALSDGQEMIRFLGMTGMMVGAIWTVVSILYTKDVMKMKGGWG